MPNYFEKGKLTQPRETATYEKFLDFINKRAECGNPDFQPVAARLRDLSANDLQELKALWYRDCLLVNKTSIQRDEKKHQAASEIVKKGRERPIQSQEPSDNGEASTALKPSTLKRRSSVDTFITLQVMNDLWLEAFFKERPVVRDALKSSVIQLSKACISREGLRDAHTKLMVTLESLNLGEQRASFDQQHSANPMFQWARQYKRQVISLLQFLESNWTRRLAPSLGLPRESLCVFLCT